MNKDLGVKILFGVILLFSLYLIISGLTANENSSKNNEILEQELQISKANIILDVGGEDEVIATIIPDNATYKNLTWESANNNIVTVTDGKVKAISPGKTVIKVSTERRKITKIINVTVNNPVINVEEITVKENTMELEVGDTKKIEYEVKPSNATDRKISFSTSDKDILGFNQEGFLVGIKAGTATVTLKSSNGKVTTVTVNVKDKKIDVSKVTLNKKSITLEIGKSETLTAKVSPINATNKNVIWKSSNEKVATVKNGKVTAKKAGTAKITVKTEDQNKEATCTVTVKEKTPSTVTANPIIPSNPVYKYEGSTFKYYVTQTNRYYLTYIWMQDPYNQIKKLDANVAKYGKVLKDSELTGSYTPNRGTVGEMMNGYISHNIIPVNKAAIGFNASGFYVAGSWDPPATYYNYHSNSWFDMMNGTILRNYQDDGKTHDSGMIGIGADGNLKIYPIAVSKSERSTVYNQIMSDKVKNTWSFYPPLVKDGKVYDVGFDNTAQRQAICQVNSNNYLMLTTLSGFGYREMGSLFVSLGCKTAHNLDGGGSTSMFIHRPGERTATQIKCSDGGNHSRCRSIIEGIYFTEK